MPTIRDVNTRTPRQLAGFLHVRIFICLCVLFPGIGNPAGLLLAQHPVTFRHLNTSNGLSYLGISDMCTDRAGNLWIGTGNGLNKFNGQMTERFYASEHPALQNNNIVHVACDQQDRIWVLTVNGNLTIVDEERKFHRAGLYLDKTFLKTRWILDTRDGQLLLFTSAGHYRLKPDLNITSMDSLTINDFEYVPVSGFGPVQEMGYRQVFRFDDQHYFFIQDTIIYNVNYATYAVENIWRPGAIVALTKMKDGSLLAFDIREKRVRQIHLETLTSSYPFSTITDQRGQPVNATFRFAEWINEETILLTTEKAGIYIYQPSIQKLTNYRHHYHDATSISSNTTSTIKVHPSGWVFITCAPAGLSYFDWNEKVHTVSVFENGEGKGYDNYITGIATTDHIHYYLGTSEGLVKWNRTTAHSDFLTYKIGSGQFFPDGDEIISIAIDHLEQKWMATQTQGVFVIDRHDKLLKRFRNDLTDQPSIKIERPSRIYYGPDQYIWITGRNGISRIDPVTLREDRFAGQPLAYFDSLLVTVMKFDGPDHLWIALGNTKGVAEVYLSSGKIKRYTTKDGLVHNGVFDLGLDHDGNAYVGSRGGLSIIYRNGRIKTLTHKDGLLMDRAEGLLQDEHGRMWIGNDIGLACYTPADSSLRTFDTRHGLSVFGFRVGSYFKMANGEFMLGTPHGLQYFRPDELFDKNVNVTPLIHKMETRNMLSNINADTSFQLTSNDRQVTFHFSTIDFSPFIHSVYQYKLEGLDPHWIEIVNQHAVRYTSLPPGQYTFRVRVSLDQHNWQEAKNKVHITIPHPFFTQTWFIGLTALLLGGFIYLIIRNERRKQAAKHEQLETEVVLHYFASQINKHKNVEDLCWDVAKNCISKLGLEECVIYRLDPESNLLIQTAAHGPKNPDAHTILQPIRIPVGQGITGHVASTKKAEIVNNTSHDPRYIVDDAARQSEIAVPILLEDNVIGVIDSEHSQKNFFTTRHLHLLSAIAVLTATQIQRIQAEADKQKAQIEVLQNKQKAMESRLQSLRLQMNPHFLFNALNSIQQMILANEEMVATKYLSRFSKLLRSVLVHSDKETITLREELDILKLYVELESVRFKEAFSYIIDCDEDIDTDEVKIPTLLIQPFVENAIWHGLMHKEGKRHLTISFTDAGDHVLCIVEDNGIGRDKAKERSMTSGQHKQHTSKGIAVSLERLQAMQKNGHAPGSMQIIDLQDDQGNACGTRVEIKLPVQN